MAFYGGSRGFDEMKAKLYEISKRFPAEAGGALYQEMLIEMAESMRRTPVKTGALRASHVTLQPEMRGKMIIVRIEVGGPAVPYAVYVHEDLEAEHPTGQAKFLESTLRESAKFMAERVAKRIDLGRLAR